MEPIDDTLNCDAKCPHMKRHGHCDFYNEKLDMDYRRDSKTVVYFMCDRCAEDTYGEENPLRYYP